MKRSVYVLVGILFLFFLTSVAPAQFREERTGRGISMTSGLGFEYFTRTIEWDGEEASSKLKSHFFTFHTEFELQPGLSLGALIGYSLSDYQAMVFRELPFSLELETGGIGGIIFGAELKKSLFFVRNFEIGVVGQFVYYSGGKEEWDIPGLAVEATAEGNPSWLRALAGPVFIYRGMENFRPYLGLSYNRLWGKFKMDQTIKDLEGSEHKKITGKSLFCTVVGAVYEVTEAFGFKGETNIMPYKNGVDIGVMIRAVYAF
ncbi:MAG: hypothetical protein ACLFVG_09250 [Candidatus Aminicenantes bacterium]